MYLNMCRHVFIYIYIYKLASCLAANAGTRVYGYTCIEICLCIGYTCVSICFKCVFMYLNMYVNMCMNIYVHIYIRTCVTSRSQCWNKYGYIYIFSEPVSTCPRLWSGHVHSDGREWAHSLLVGTSARRLGGDACIWVGRGERRHTSDLRPSAYSQPSGIEQCFFVCVLLFLCVRRCSSSGGRTSCPCRWFSAYRARGGGAGARRARRQSPCIVSTSTSRSTTTN